MGAGIGKSRSKADVAWRARTAGATWAEAAAMSGYASAQSCYKSVVKHRGALPQVEADHLRELWRERLETLWRQALRDVADRRPSAVTHGVRVASAAAALDGLNAAAKVELGTESSLTELITALTDGSGDGR